MWPTDLQGFTGRDTSLAEFPIMTLQTTLICVGAPRLRWDITRSGSNEPSDSMLLPCIRGCVVPGQILVGFQSHCPGIPLRFWQGQDQLSSRWTQTEHAALPRPSRDLRFSTPASDLRTGSNRHDRRKANHIMIGEPSA
jgi:hypothetical protein